MDKSSLSEADIETLIQLVEERPSIWDKSCNKDFAEKRKAWREIFDHFSRSRWRRDWEDLDENEQKKWEQELTGKWTNLRDTFTKLGKKGKEQNYRHYELLKFFMKNIEVEPLPSTSGVKFSTPLENGNKFSTPSFKRLKKPSPSLRIDLSKKRKRTSFSPKTCKTKPIHRRVVSSSPAVSSSQFATDTPASVSSPQFATDTPASVSSPKFVTTNAVSSPQFVTTNTVDAVPSPQFATNTAASVSSPQFLENNVNPSPVANHKNNIDEDEAFFISIMPSVKKMSDFDKLEFRIGVLGVLKRIASDLQ